MEKTAPTRLEKYSDFLIDGYCWGLLYRCDEVIPSPDFTTQRNLWSPFGNISKIMEGEVNRVYVKPRATDEPARSLQMEVCEAIYMAAENNRPLLDAHVGSRSLLNREGGLYDEGYIPPQEEVVGKLIELSESGEVFPFMQQLPLTSKDLSLRIEDPITIIGLVGLRYWHLRAWEMSLHF